MLIYLTYFLAFSRVSSFFAQVPMDTVSRSNLPLVVASSTAIVTPEIGVPVGDWKSDKIDSAFVVRNSFRLARVLRLALAWLSRSA